MAEFANPLLRPARDARPKPGGSVESTSSHRQLAAIEHLFRNEPCLNRRAPQARSEHDLPDVGVEPEQLSRKTEQNASGAGADWLLHQSGLNRTAPLGLQVRNLLQPIQRVV